MITLPTLWFIYWIMVALIGGIYMCSCYHDKTVEIPVILCILYGTFMGLVWPLVIVIEPLILVDRARKK